MSKEVLTRAEMTQQYEDEVVQAARDVAVPGIAKRDVARRVAVDLGKSEDHVRRVLRRHEKENPDSPIFLSKAQFADLVINKARLLVKSSPTISGREASRLIALDVCGDDSFQEKIRGIIATHNRRHPADKIFVWKKEETNKIVNNAISLNAEGVHRTEALTTVANQFNLTRSATWARLRRYSSKHDNVPVLRNTRSSVTPSYADSESLLIQKAVAGDGAAFGALCNEVAPYVTSIARSRIDPDSVDDLVQQTFIKAFNGIRNFRGRSPRAFRSWLGTIVTTLSIDTYRSRGRRKEVRSEIAIETEPVFDDLDARLAQSEQRARVHAALQLLPETQRLYVGDIYLGTLTQGDVAEKYGTTPGAVKHEISRARVNLREHLQMV